MTIKELKTDKIMMKELEDAIIKTVQENTDQIQPNSYITGLYKKYIYTKQGEYDTPISGEAISDLIEKFTNLYTK